jgi:hypothetical protein
MGSLCGKAYENECSAGELGVFHIACFSLVPAEMKMWPSLLPIQVSVPSKQTR